MTVSELLKMLSLMESAGLGDSKILVFDSNYTALGFVNDWSIEDEVDNPHCCALWLGHDGE